MNSPLGMLNRRGLRIVVTRPPTEWFFGLAHQYASLYAETLRSMGAEVLAIPVLPFVAGDGRNAKEIVSEVRRFRPHLAVGLSDAGYALLCRWRRGWWWRRELANIFTEWLEVPTIMIWDHALLQFAPILLDLPDRPDQSKRGCVDTFRAELSHPLFLHVARDSGHREVMHQLGVLPRERVLLMPAFAHPGCAAVEGTTPSADAVDLAFFGSVRELRLDRRPARHHQALVELREAVLRKKLERLDVPLWDLFTRGIDALPRPLRSSLQLEPDQSFYWSLLAGEVEVCQSRLRIAVLQSVGDRLDYYGHFGDPELAGPLRLRSETFAFGGDLGEAFHRARIVLDLVNQGWIHGFGSKVMNCFAAGGFMLLDRKRDFVDLFGPLAEAVSYASLSELGGKVDRYLGNVRERVELSAALGERIRSDYLMPSLIGPILDRALELRP